MLTKRAIKFAFCYESMFSSKMHQVKEKDFNRDKIYSDNKTIFSKDKRSKKFKMIDVKIPDINPPKSNYYMYDKNTVQVPRDVYVAPLKRAVKLRLQKKEYQIFKQQQTTVQEEEDVFVDELWGDKPPIKYFEKSNGKDLFFNYRSPRYIEYIGRKNDFLTRPLLLNGEIKQIVEKIRTEGAAQLKKIYHPNFFIEDYYKKLPELFKELKAAISEASYKELPQIALSLQFDLYYKEDIFKIWKEIEEIAMKHIHHYSTQELINLKWGLATTYPKACSYQLHYLIYQLVQEDYLKLNVKQLVSALFAFRTMNQDTFSKKIIGTLIEKLPEYQDDHEQLAQVFYSIANNLQKKHQRHQSIDITLDQKYRLDIANAFVGPLKKGKYDMDNCTRILLALTLLRVPDFNDLSFIIEKQLTAPDEFQLVHILYALSKGNNGFPLGEESTYKFLEPFALKYFDQYENLEKSRIYFAYSQRSGEFAKNQIFLNWIKQNIRHLTYSELQNVVYGLMFNQINDKQIWMDFVHNLGFHNDCIPLANYFCFKQAFYYIKQFYPDWNMKPLEESATNAEYMFMPHRMQRSFQGAKQIDFQIELNTLVPYNWTTFYTWKNTYYLPIVLEETRIAVILQTKEHNRAHLQLQQQIMQTEDWKLIIFDSDQIYSMKQTDRANHFKSVIDAAISEQKQKIPTWDQQRREEIYKNLYIMAERSITPGKRIVTEEDTLDLSRQPL